MSLLIDAMLVGIIAGTIACSLLTIYYTRKATANWKRAEVLWNQAADNWREVARLRGLK